MATLNPTYPGAVPAPSRPRAGASATTRKASRAPRLAAVLASLALITGGGYVAYERFVPQTAAVAAVTTADIVVGNITSTVSATGNVASPAQSKVGFLTSGQLLELLTRVGDTVVAGQAIARIDDSSLRLALAQAQAGYDAAVATLQKTAAGATAAEVAAAQAQVDAARISLAQTQSVPRGAETAAQSQLASAQIQLQKLQNPSAADIRAAQAQLDAADAKLEAVLNPRPEDIAAAQSEITQAGLQLAALVNPRAEDVRSAELTLATAQASLATLQNPRAEDVATAQIQLDQARTALAQLTDKPQTQVQAGIPSYEIAAAQASVDQARTSLDQARANLAGAILTAPISGTVAATGANVGEQVASSTAVVTLVDTQQVRVDVAVDESGVARIKVGQPATITFEALSGGRVAGTVSVISPLATTTNGVVTYAVQIALDAQQAQQAGVRSGMTATAAIVSDSREGVVLAPNRAIKTQGQNKTVQVLTATGATETRTVKVGLANDQNTEILSGLQAGDKVVITGTTAAAVSAAGSVAGIGVAGAAGGPRG